MTMSGELDTDDKLSAAFLHARKSRPYFATGFALLVRRIGEFPDGTMAVTRGGILLVDPRFVELCEVPQLGEVLTHELLHILRDHAGRSDQVSSVDRRRWNVAADCEINPNLWRTLLPGAPCMPEKYGLPNGLLAEEYYEKLPTVEITGSVCAGACGSGSGGEKVDGEPNEEDSAARSPSDLRRARQEVAAATVEHSRRRPGSVPGSLLRWAEAVLSPPKVRWQDRLRKLVRVGVATARGKVDYTFVRPNRRTSCLVAAARSLGGAAVVLPALCGREPQIAVAVDTSGSMLEGDLRDAMSEVSGVLRASGTPAVFLACDSDLAGPPKQVRSAAEACRLLRGGGGTDFRPVFAEVERMRRRPDLLVFCTDGCGPAPESPPAGTSVVWVLVGADAKVPAPWGEHVFVREEDQTCRS
jgi:predicted metal-dependent peptidase